MADGKGLKTIFRSKNEVKLGETFIPSIRNIDVTLYGKVPEKTDKVDVILGNEEVHRYIHGNRKRMIQVLGSNGTGQTSIFEAATINHSPDTRYLYETSTTIIKALRPQEEKQEERST